VNHHGRSGKFSIRRCTDTKEGPRVFCKYNVVYNMVKDDIQIDHLRCMKKKWCDKTVNMDAIDREQLVTELFKQHCLRITHSLKTGDNQISAEFVDQYEENGKMVDCIMI